MEFLCIAAVVLLVIFILKLVWKAAKLILNVLLVLAGIAVLIALIMLII